MSTNFNVNFLSHHSKKEFDDYYLQIAEILVSTKNSIILDEILNVENSKYSSGSFSLSGEGFKGYKVSLRMPKGSQLNAEEIVEFIQLAVAKAYPKLKLA